MKLLKRLLTILLFTVILLFAVFLIGRYCWKLGGFCACESAGIEQVNVEENQVQIRGFFPGSFPEGFLGYHSKQIDSTLYVGFKFSGLFGIFETGDFDITIPTNGKVTQVVIKTKNNEYPIWLEESSLSEEGDIAAVPTLYERILDKYCIAFKENWDGQRLTDEGINLMIRDIAQETLGYAVKDLDDNGIPELAIGTVSGDDFYGKLILDLYTLDKDGEPVLIFSSIERDRYYYAGGNLFAHLSSSSAADSFVTTLKLEGEGLVDMTFITNPAEYVQMELVSVIESYGE